MSAVVSDHRTLGVLCVILTLDLLAFTLILPLFPAILDHYASNSKEGDLHWQLTRLVHRFCDVVGVPQLARYNSVLFGGLLGSLFSFLQFLSAPIVGALSDKFGRKTFTIFSALGSLTSYLLWSQAQAFHVFVLSRVVGGLSKTIVNLSTAMVSDLLPLEKRGRGMAYIGVCFSLAFLIGPSIGAWFAVRARAAQTDFYVHPACFAASVTLIELLLILAFLPETLPEDRRSTSSSSFSNALNYVSPQSLFSFESLQKKLEPAELRRARVLGLTYFLYLFIYSGLEFTLTFLTHERLGYDGVKQGRMFVFVGLIMILVQGGVSRCIALNRQKSAALGALTLAIPAFLLIAFAYTATTLLSGLLLYSVTSAITVPALTTMISACGSPADKGILTGIFRSLGALARAVGPLLAACAFWIAGPTPTYIAGGVAMLLPLLLLRSCE